MGVFSIRISRDLKAFLKEEDLNDLTKIGSNIKQLNRKDIKKIRSTLQKWNSPQAVSNLLFHPSLIPGDIRASCILKGLREKKNSYYILATVVGLQGINSTEFLEEERDDIKKSLIFILKTSGGVISARASISISDYISSEDAFTMFKLLDHPDDTTKHNILCWLIRAMEDKGPDAFISMVRSSCMPEDVQEEAIEKLHEYLRQKEAGEYNLFTMPLYVNIPNLREYCKDH